MYFAWGETQGYIGITTEKGFYWGDYKWCNGSYNTLTKYNTKSASGTVDNMKTLELIDDAAYTSDNTCRMPTKTELQELTTNTTSTWETLNGVNGRRFISNTNGNSIFVPAVGYCVSGSVTHDSEGFLWSSSLNKSYPRYGSCLFFGSNNAYVADLDRYCGSSVRAVKD